MAVYTTIDDGALRHMLGIYDGLGALVRFEGVAAGSINTTYRVETERAPLYLRINEGKAFADLVFEKNLLERLATHCAALDDVATPRIVKNCIGGSFFPIVAGKQAVLFEELKGRELAIFELAPAHLEAVGAFLARAHAVLAEHDETRPNPYGAPVITRWLDELKRDGVLPDVTARLAHVVDVAARELSSGLPRGLIHGDLFINNTKWRRGRLAAVFDWEMAGSDALVVDIAITALAWAWRREEPSAPFALNQALVRALVDGYASVRPLEPAEIAAAHAALRFAAARFAVTRIRDFVVGSDRADDGARVHLDYREYIARLDALDEGGANASRALFTPSGATP